MSNDIMKINMTGLIQREEILPPAKDVLPLHEQDFEAMRKNLQMIIAHASVAIEDAATIASQAQHPRNYEALSALMRTAVDASTKLMELHQTMERITQHKIKAENEDNSNQRAGGNTNIIMVGTTKELAEMLKQVKKENV